MKTLLLFPYRYFLFPVFFLLLWSSCKKEKKEITPDPPPVVVKDPELPEYTETGENTLSFVFDHQLVISDDPDVFGSGGVKSTYTSLGYLDISGGESSDTTYKELFFDLKGILKFGTYRLDSNNNVLFSFQQGNIYKDYKTTNVYTGELIITKLDTANKIISGKFHFKARRQCDYGDTCSGVIEIPKGQFDVTYRDH